MENLKPCPFCGGKAEVVTRFVTLERKGVDRPIGYYVTCKKCHATSNFFDAKNAERLGGYKVFAKYAIDAWNKRADMREGNE